MFRRDEGFTLVELAIVLVIIGIILGAVLKGQQLIFNAKVKRLQSQVKEMMAAFYTYYDKYGYYPGDDPLAKTRFPNISNIRNGDGDGLVEGGYCDKNKDESCQLWRHLRAANIISGDPEVKFSALSPRHIFGGQLDMFTGTYTVGGVQRSGLWITLRHIEAQAAAALDRAIDDGKCDSGSMARYSGTNCGNNGEYPESGYLDVWINF